LKQKPRRYTPRETRRPLWPEAARPLNFWTFRFGTKFQKKFYAVSHVYANAICHVALKWISLIPG